jgi:hypothetical protein
VDKGYSHLDPLDALPHEFGCFECQLLLCDGLARVLIASGGDLVIAFVEMLVG